MPPYPKTSWRSWSDILTEPAVADEAQRIAVELESLAAKADFPVEFLPLAKVTNEEQVAQVLRGDFDVVLIFAASNYAVFPHLWAMDLRGTTRPPSQSIPAWERSSECLTPRWVGIGGTVRKNPCLSICRSQQDVEIRGQWKRLIREGATRTG